MLQKDDTQILILYADREDVPKVKFHPDINFLSPDIILNGKKLYIVSLGDFHLSD